MGVAMLSLIPTIGGSRANNRYHEVGNMQNRVGFIFALFALTQVALLGFSAAILMLKLRGIDGELIRVGAEEQQFLNRLADTERDLYRTSILLRDVQILKGPEEQRAQRELVDLLRQLSRSSLESPVWLSSEMQANVQAVEVAKVEFLTVAAAVSAWQEADRQALGGKYLIQQLSPLRERFSDTARLIVGLVRSLHQSRVSAQTETLHGIETLMLRILGACAILGLGLASVAIWRFRSFESERNMHLERLTEAENGLRSLSQRLVESQEDERKKLSRELHDEVGQILTALRVQLGQIQTSESPDPHLVRAAELVDRSLKTVREMARGLRPAMLDDLGLGPAMKWLSRDFSKHAALDVDVEIEGEFGEVSDHVRTCLYRVAQEALTNCVKHSGASSVRVLLQESPREIVLTVQDNGSGFTPAASNGIGLLGMRERVAELGGEFAVVPTPGAGTLIQVKIPTKMKRRT